MQFANMPKHSAIVLGVGECAGWEDELLVNLLQMFT